MIRIAGPLWGIIGITALLGWAIFRLYPHAADAIREGLSIPQWIILVIWTIFMLGAEGYRGFQKKFSPRTAARVRFLRDHPNVSHALLAPLFCMGYFYATRKTKIVAICLTAGIILLVVLVKLCPQPWRGIIDFGVVLGLTYGLISFFAYIYQALTRESFPHSPETPSPE